MLEQTLAEPRSSSTLEYVDGFVRGRVSIVLPAFNEEANIAQTISKVREQFKTVCADCEIIVVDDGSRDGTWAAVETLGTKERAIRSRGDSTTRLAKSRSWSIATWKSGRRTLLHSLLP